MRATAIAQPNIALVKYWGKRDTRRNLPAVGSLSVTLDALRTTMDVEFCEGMENDVLTLNDEPADRMLARVSRCLDSVAGEKRPRARIRSRCNFPVAAGLASSASSFAALVVAAMAAAGRREDPLTLARLAGAASGSAARSLFGGVVELVAREDDIDVSMIAAADAWPLQVVVAVTAASEKPVSSGDAMQRSAATSPFYGRWLAEQPSDLEAARTAVDNRDFELLGETAEHNCLKMHSLTWTSRPALVYWNDVTLACMQRIRELRAAGHGVFFTIDAGPQVKAVCRPEDADAVAGALAGIDGIVQILRTGLGDGARLTDDP